VEKKVLDQLTVDLDEYFWPLNLEEEAQFITADEMIDRIVFMIKPNFDDKKHFILE
jgi:hypothetical protein